MQVYAAILLMALLQSESVRQPDGPSSGTERVRVTHLRLQYALHHGVHRSSTLRRLLRELESSNVIVYVEAGGCLQADAAGCLVFQGTRHGYRYIRIRVNPAQVTDRLIVTLAHEFQHALEVARAPSVVDESSLTAHFQQIGRVTRMEKWISYETQAAIVIERAAKTELKISARVHTPAPGVAVPDCEAIERFCVCDRRH